MKYAALAGALTLACAALAGCTSTGSVTPAVSADIVNALAIGCPIAAAIQISGLPLNAAEKAALATLALACPPNPPPTSAAVAATDIIAAYVALEPLLASKK